MSVFNSISVAVLIVLLVAGALTGLAVSGTDLFNPRTSQAEAERIRAEVAHQQTMDNLQEQLLRAKTEAEIASIQRQQEAEQKRFEAEMKYIGQLYARKLTAFDSWIKVRDTLLLVLGSAVSLGFLVFVTAKSAAVLRSASPVPSLPNKKEEEKQYWRRQRKMARANERWSRTNTLLKNIKDPARMSKEDYDKSPLAGD